jgi:superfamily II DNA or RNA helicase
MARQFAEELTRNGIEARAVAGEDSGNDRTGSLDWFARTGKGSALCNAMLLTEGFDQPDVDCVVVLRPTEIRSLYAQMIGRGTRIHPGKENLLVLDFLWLTEQHQLVNMSRLVASNPEDALAVDALIAAGEEVDPLEAQRDAEEERLRKLIKILNTVKTRPAGTYDAIELAVAMHDEELMEFVPSLEWHEKPVSPAQADALLKAGFDPASVTCRGHASKILDRIALRRLNNLATPKQVRQLKRLGHANPHTETFKGASEFITKRFNR